MEQLTRGQGQGRGTASLVAAGQRGVATRPLAIETRGLRKVYGEKVAVEDVTIAVPEGEVFATSS